MDTQLIVSGSQEVSLTPFEEAIVRAIKFGLALESCQQMKAFVDAIDDSDEVECSWLEKVYAAEICNVESDIN